MAFITLDRLSDPGTPGAPNEDRLAAGEGFGLVIDGATGLADARLIDAGETDAGWLAEKAAALLAQDLADPDISPPEMVRRTNAALRDALDGLMADRRADGPRRIADAPGYARPTAAFQALREITGPDDVVTLETAGLGDCTLLIEDAASGLRRFSGSTRPRDGEQAAARAALEIAGGLDGAKAFLRRPEVLERLRRARAAHNTPGGPVWTLGAAPEAAEHLIVARFAASAPAIALLATDGFMDLADLYRAYDHAGLLRAATTRGLAPLLDELRRLEREVDPQGARHPRFKRSDDATALLLRID